MSTHTTTAAYLNPSALAALNIKHQPFALPNQDKLYSDPELDAQLEMLRHNLHYSQLTQVFLGEKGSGKTSLVLRLLYNIAEDIEVFVSNADSRLSTDKIIQELLLALEIKATDSPIKSVLRALQSKTYPDQVAALVIDDAHLLQLHELEKLLAMVRSINQELDGRLHLLLIAEPQFKSTLDAFANSILPTQQVFTCSIKAFDTQQSQNYLQYRFELLGIDLPFSQNQLHEIHEKSLGLPAQINYHASEQLNVLYSNLPTTEGKVPAWRLPALIASIIFIALPLVILVWDKPEMEPQTVEKPAAVVSNAELVYKDQLDAPAPIVPSSPSTDSLSLPAKLNETINADISTDISTDEILRAKVSQSKPAPQPVIPTDLVTQKPQIKVTPILNLKSTIRTADWLLKQATNQYVIQILALENSAAFHTFIQKAPSSPQIAVFTTRYQDHDWYVAVYGLYPTANVARAAIEKLPSSLRRNRPWVRSIDSIQQAIKQQTP